MTTLDERLSALDDLHLGGYLTQNEVEAARAKLLAQSPPAPVPQSANTGMRKERWHIENRLDAEASRWEREREGLLVQGGFGAATVPSAARGVVSGVSVALMLIAVAVLRNGSPYSVLIGGLGVAIGATVAWEAGRKARAYRTAEESHRREMARLHAELARMDSGAVALR